jgi:hypothetical protein
VRTIPPALSQGGRAVLMRVAMVRADECEALPGGGKIDTKRPAGGVSERVLVSQLAT